MLSKSVFLVFLLIPLFLAAQDSPSLCSSKRDGASEECSSEVEESTPTVNGTESEKPSEGPETPDPPASSDTNSTTSESETPTTSGTSHINWTNALVLALAILLKQM